MRASASPICRRIATSKSRAPHGDRFGTPDSEAALGGCRIRASQRRGFVRSASAPLLGARAASSVRKTQPAGARQTRPLPENWQQRWPHASPERLPQIAAG